MSKFHYVDSQLNSRQGSLTTFIWTYEIGLVLITKYKRSHIYVINNLSATLTQLILITIPSSGYLHPLFFWFVRLHLPVLLLNLYKLQLLKHSTFFNVMSKYIQANNLKPMTFVIALFSEWIRPPRVHKLVTFYRLFII